MAFTLRLRAALVALIVQAMTHWAMASQIAAWWTSLGPSVMLLNATTGMIEHSLCNSRGTPIFPIGNSATNVFDTRSYPPRPGSSIAGVGYKDSTKVVASIFYQLNNGSLVQALFNCDDVTGQYNSPTSTRIISGTGGPVPNTETGLAAILLGAEGGYRVYYHDQLNGVHELGYMTARGWYYIGAITQDPLSGKAIHAAFTVGGTGYNISAVMPRDPSNIEVSRFFADGTWHLGTFPQSLANVPTNLTIASEVQVNYTVPTNFTMPAWTGNPGSIGIAIDNQFTRWVYYFGSDRRLYQISSINFVWRPVPASSDPGTVDLVWPAAAEANAQLAVASDKTSSAARVYYFAEGKGSRGQLIEARVDRGVWRNAELVPVKNDTSAPVPGETVSTPDGNNTEGSSSSGLSVAAEVGIGVGVALVGLAAISAAIFFYLRRRKRQQEQALQGNADLPPGYQAELPGGSARGQAPGAVGFDSHGSMHQLSPAAKAAETSASPYQTYGPLVWGDEQQQKHAQARAAPLAHPQELDSGTWAIELPAAHGNNANANANGGHNANYQYLIHENQQQQAAPSPGSTFVPTPTPTPSLGPTPGHYDQQHQPHYTSAVAPSSLPPPEADAVRPARSFEISRDDGRGFHRE